MVSIACAEPLKWSPACNELMLLFCYVYRVNGNHDTDFPRDNLSHGEDFPTFTFCKEGKTCDIA